MNTQRFILHGISGVYNYGCEAIVRGTLRILRSRWPECHIVYLSRRPGEDRRALADCALEIIDCRLPQKWSPKRIVKAGIRRLGLPTEWLLLERLPELGPTDCVLSIGGDIFTLGPGPYHGDPHVEKVRIAERILATGCQWVLWGASVGPFSAWPEAEQHFVDLLSRASLITVREPWTERYLTSLGITANTTPVADPAFLMEADAGTEVVGLPSDDTIRTVGINLSPLSVYHRMGVASLHDAAGQQAQFVSRLLRRHHVRVTLVPHVIAPHSTLDDDYRFLQEVFQRIEDRGRDRVVLLPPGLGARQTKGFLASCHAVAAARMHCAIAAVSVGVPTLFLSYSAKARGMAEYVYGEQGDRFCIDIGQIDSHQGDAQMDALLESRSVTHPVLEARRSAWRDQALAAGDALCGGEGFHRVGRAGSRDDS